MTCAARDLHKAAPKRRLSEKTCVYAAGPERSCTAAAVALRPLAVSTTTPIVLCAAVGIGGEHLEANEGDGGFNRRQQRQRQWGLAAPS